MKEKLKDKIFAFAFDMAFRDATMRNAFKRRESEQHKQSDTKEVKAEKDELYRQRKEDVKVNARDRVKRYIDEIIDERYPDPIQAIEDVCNRTDSFDFTFGNAQKLVNMTAKYMFMATYGKPEMRVLFKGCHCPMDGVMIEFVARGFKDKKELVGFESTEEYKAFIALKWKRAWSQLDGDLPKEYERFTDCIEKIADMVGMLPIEVDYLYWDE